MYDDEESKINIRLIIGIVIILAIFEFLLITLKSPHESIKEEVSTTTHMEFKDDFDNSFTSVITPIDSGNDTVDSKTKK